MSNLSKLDNYSLKLSELRHPHNEWNVGQNLQILKRTLVSFDPMKIMFASNMLVSSLTVSFIDWLNLVEQAIAPLDDTIRQAILWQTAQKVYQINLEKTPIRPNFICDLFLLTWSKTEMSELIKKKPNRF